MGIGHVQDARIAETFEIVDAGIIGAARETRPSACERGSARELEKIAAADGHQVSLLVLIFWLSMILSENRFPIFRIMLRD
jgi:hypothetical protein